MRIADNVCDRMDLSHSSQTKDLFDLDLKVSQLKIGRADIAHLSQACTQNIGCQYTGTGQSFCCTTTIR